MLLPISINVLIRISLMLMQSDYLFQVLQSTSVYKEKNDYEY